MNTDDLTPEQARRFAAHKARTAQTAYDWARELQTEELIEKAVAGTKASLREELRAIFGEGDQADPAKMRVLVQRVPILCQDIKTMHGDIAAVRDSVAAINDNFKWGIRIIIGAVILAVLKIILIP